MAAQTPWGDSGNHGRDMEGMPFGRAFASRIPGPFFGWVRPRRGDVRTGILFLLSEQPMHGYQLIQELAERSGGVWRPSSGSVYPALQKLENEGLVRSLEADGRRVFELTEVGRTEAERRKDEPGPWDMGEMNDPLAVIRDQFYGVVAAAMHVAQTGGPAELARVNKILAETYKRLYRLLAEDE